MIPIPKQEELPVQYLRDHDNLITVTISGLKLDDGRVAFGFAYRSDNDTPDRTRGGTLAKKRLTGMLRAAQNGVPSLSNVASTPKRGDVVLKSFLGAEKELVYQLGLLHLPVQYYRQLHDRVGKIIDGINKKNSGK